MSSTTGALGMPWRAAVTPWGAVVPWDGSAELDWAVAADDRWHRPRAEVAVRQQRDGGTPVFETRLRIPGGDAVQRVWSVADRGGLTIVELTNDSPLPIAVALTRPDVMTARPPVDLPIEGIDLPAGSLVVPIGHRATTAVALAHDGRGGGPLPGGLPSAGAVARGWRALAERASRLELPDRHAVDAVVAARSELLLAGSPDGGADPAGFLLAVGELARLGELDFAAAEGSVEAVASAAEAIARAPGWDVDAALDAAGLVLGRAGEHRAVADLAALVGRRAPAATGPGDADGIRAVAAVERRLLRRGELLPDGMPPAWRGTPFEAHGLAAGAASRVSFAVRWHGERPAVLWQVEGDPITLTAPAVDARWRTGDASGEALWAASAATVRRPPTS